ncbi:MAG: sigma-70 factor domain-containing protein [Myxococcota bacterium]
MPAKSSRKKSTAKTKAGKSKAEEVVGQNFAVGLFSAGPSKAAARAAANAANASASTETKAKRPEPEAEPEAAAPDLATSEDDSLVLDSNETADDAEVLDLFYKSAGAPAEAAPVVRVSPAKLKKDAVDSIYKSTDPVRMYLRKMGSEPLLTREGEVAIAKRIEEGEKEVLAVVISSRVAIQEIIELGDKLRRDEVPCAMWCGILKGTRGKRLPRSVVRRFASKLIKSPSFFRENDKLTGQSEERQPTERARDRVDAALAKNQGAMQLALEEIRINKKQIDRIIMRLKALIHRVERADEKVRSVEQAFGLDPDGLSNLLRETKKSTKDHRRLCKDSGIDAETMDDAERIQKAAGARRRISRRRRGFYRGTPQNSRFHHCG